MMPRHLPHHWKQSVGSAVVGFVGGDGRQRCCANAAAGPTLALPMGIVVPQPLNGGMPGMTWRELRVAR